MSKSLHRPAAKLSRITPRDLIDRLADSPRLVRRLPSEILHRIVATHGLEECGAILAQASAEQLQAVFDLDLWSAVRPGSDETFDADRFGAWLDVLVEVGEEVAAQRLAELDPRLVIAALAQHARVFDTGAAAADGHELGGYVLVPRRTVSWDSICAALTAMKAGHPRAFHRVMRGCVALSNDGFEPDGLDDLLSDRDQVMFDLASSRDARREEQGFCSPEQARVFLRIGRDLDTSRDSTPPADTVARAGLRSLASPPPDAVAIDGPRSPALDRFNAVLHDLLRPLAPTGPPLRALLGPAAGQPLRLVDRMLDGSGYEAETAARTGELALLANVLIAGCSFQAREFTREEASRAALAICNLGLDGWPRHWAGAHDLIVPFQVGWALLHHEVCMYAAERLIATLNQVTFSDGETRHGLDALNAEMRKQWLAATPWAARDSLDVLATLDLPTWAALLAFIDQCPVMHPVVTAGPGVRSVDPLAFQFIADTAAVRRCQEFLDGLAGRLSA